MLTESRYQLNHRTADRLAAENETLRLRVQAQSLALRQAAMEAESFDYSIAHDLRTPLRAVASTASILLNELGPRLESDHRLLLTRQVHNARKFGELIDGLLEYSRLGRAGIRKKPIDVTTLVRRFDPRVQAQEGMRILADPDLTIVALHCLIDNALKFSPRGPIQVRQKLGTISVVDSGIGFDAAYAHKIFLPFERLVGEEFPGTGIGLAKVKRIVDRHQGRVWAEGAPGHGSTFSMNLP